MSPRQRAEPQPEQRDGGGDLLDDPNREAVGVEPIWTGADEGGGEGGDGGPSTATVTGVNPGSAVVGGPPLTVSVTGSGFTDQTVIVFNGGDEPTTFVSASEVTTEVQPATAVGPATVPVTVRNPGEDPADPPGSFEFTEEPAG